MTTALCPYCYQPQAVGDEQAAGPIRCPACGNFFDADAPAVVVGDAAAALPPPVHAPERLATRLTAPHTCHQCKGAFPEPSGLPRSTRVCPLCHKKTSVYARIYFCPECRALLESPAATEGRRVKCPACERTVTVPRELAFRGREGDFDAAWFAYPCPACDQLLHSRRDCAREVTFCPACRQVCAVPDHGFAEAQRQPHLLDERQAVVRGPMRRCPRCRMSIPRHGRACPYCSPLS